MAAQGKVDTRKSSKADVDISKGVLQLQWSAVELLFVVYLLSFLFPGFS